MKQLDKKRKELDQLDLEIVSLLGRRIDIVRKIGKIKKKLGNKVKDKQREKKVITSLTEQSKKHKIDQSLIKKIWKVLFEHSYKIEKKV